MIMSGCSTNSDIPNAQIPTKFESNFNANFGKLEISGHISKLETGIYTFTLSSPESLENTVINCMGDKISIELDGISFEADNGTLPATGFVKSVTNSLDTASKSGNVTVTKADGYNKYYALSNTGDFYILQEQNSENVVSLVIDSADISMNFSDFSTE